MKVTIQTRTGLPVNVQPAKFELVRMRIRGEAGQAESVPAMQAGSQIVESIRQAGALSTSSGLLQFETSTMGVLFASSGGNLAALLFDLAEPEIQFWLRHAKHRDDVPIMFQCGDSAQMVRVRLDDDIVDLANRASTCIRVKAAEIVSAIEVVVGQFDDPETLAQWQSRLPPLTQCSVSVLTPTAALGRNARELH